MDLIPETLRRALEDSEVVFFCGAGVSKAAGLPLFGELTEYVLEDLLPQEENCQPGSTDALTWKAFKERKYDEALGFLETAHEGGYDPRKVRERVAYHLTREPETLSNHMTLVRLTDLNTEKGRLVTTNFDTLFELAYEAIGAAKQFANESTVSVAPTLPPGKPEAFKGLVYLHGKLGHSPNNQQLVLTTADFGTAYMLEGWALRFVVDLFRHFHVVFIGYSLEDPTMRYLVRALAAAREENAQQFKKPFAFSDYVEGEDKAVREQTEREWRLRGITPLPFDRSGDFEQLWNALDAWADDHQQGIAGRRQMVARLGQNPPAPGEGDAVARDMSWALRDPKVAKFFANLKGSRCPKPGWIGPLQKQGLFGLPIVRSDDGKSIGASLVSKQLPDHLRLDRVTYQMGRWIARCLNSREAIDWALAEGAVLHREFRDLVHSQLDSEAAIEIKPAVRKLWRVLVELSYAHRLSERHQSEGFGNVSRPRLSARVPFTTRIFLDRLQPIPVFGVKPDYARRAGSENSNRPSDWYEISVELVGIRGAYEIKEFKKKAEDWECALAVMADDLTNRLAESMDWLREFGLASEEADTTHIEYRSISPHDQNRDARTWTVLIALVRDAHEARRRVGDIGGAERLELRWQSLGYPVFRRLAVNAATGTSYGDVSMGLKVLLESEDYPLWNTCVERESLRFLRKRGADLSDNQLVMVTEAILQGPPRQMYRSQLPEEDFQERRDGKIFLRLHKLVESGVVLPLAAQAEYERIQGDMPWEPRGDHSEEFAFYFSRDPDAHRFGKKRPEMDFAEIGAEQLVRWWEAVMDETEFWWDGFGWDEFLKKNLVAAVRLLKGAAAKDVWPIRLWRTALYETERQEQKEPSDDQDQDLANLLLEIPAQSLIGLATPAAWWLEHAMPKLGKRQRLKLWRRIWEASLKGKSPEGELDIDSALNVAGGILGQVLYKEMAERIPNVDVGQNSGFPRPLKSDFQRLVDSEHPSVKLARVRMAPMLSVLYRIDPDWTKQTFFSRMDCGNSTKFDPYLWEAYFWNARCPPDLLAAIKPLFLKVLVRRKLIPERVHDNAITLFVHLAIPSGQGITTEDARALLRRIGTDGLTYAAMALRDILAGAGDRSPVLWRETLEPWFKSVWPTRPTDRSADLTEHLAWMALEAGVAFPDALDTIRDVLTREEHSFVLFELKTKEEECNLVSEHAKASLELVDCVYREGSGRDLLRELLETIAGARPELIETDEYKRLLESLD